MDRIVILPGQAAVEAYRKRAARACDAASFGASVTTAGAWLAGLWPLYGDGREIASSAQRFLALEAVLADQEVLPRSAGMVALLSRLVQDGLGVPCFDAALADCGLLGATHEPLLRAVRAYERALDSAGLIDAGRAWALLAREEVIAYPACVTCEGMETPAALREFCLSQPRIVDFQDESRACAIEGAPAGVHVRFAFPSGRYAEPLLLADMLADMAKQGRVVVTARHPLALYRQVSPALSQAGIASAVQDRIRFNQTDFGRAFSCAYEVITCASVARQAAVDYLFNPFSGASKEKAHRFDKAVRADRIMARDEFMAMLRSASPAFEHFEDMCATPDACILASLFEDRARSMQEASDAYISEQLAAIRCLCDVCEGARRLGLGIEACVAALGQSSVDASRACGQGEPSVVFMGQRQAAMLEPGSVSGVVMCDMDSASYPLRERDDAASALLDALGIGRKSAPLVEARRTFRAVESLATRDFVIMRRLNSEDAAPTYPAAVVEEFVDCYRDDPSDISDIDNRYALPPCLLDKRVERGEEALYENAAVVHGVQPAAAAMDAPTLERISDAMLGHLAVPRPLGAADAADRLRRPRFSASQIESYLECPQKWFATRRLRLDDLDEKFGPAEMGDFSHGVLRTFYERFQAEVASKVGPKTLARAHEIMGEVVKASAENQPSREPKSGRLVPVTELERRQTDELADRIDVYLDYEAELLPGFRPAYFECGIATLGAIEYAGCNLVGAIDRIDMDDEGHAVVIDYKSALSSDYDLYDAQGELRGGKVQALIYAQVVRRYLGLDVVGALYVSYGRRRGASGALDRRVEPSHVPGLRPARCVYGEGPLSDLLDATEERVSQALLRLLAGDIQARPAHGRVCGWCPEISCSKRQG